MIFVLLTFWIKHHAPISELVTPAPDHKKHNIHSNETMELCVASGPSPNNINTHLCQISSQCQEFHTSIMRAFLLVKLTFVCSHIIPIFHSSSDSPPVPYLPESFTPRRPWLVHLDWGHVEYSWWWRWVDSDDDDNDSNDDLFTGDNIPGVGGSDYPTKGQADLCALNPTNPGCWKKTT